MDPLLSAAGCAVFGLAIGSFLNVVIHRVPAGMSILRPRSRCVSCEKEIRSRDNIPVVSWLLLRGRCRDCGAPISFRYPLVEVLTAAVFAVVGARFADDWALPAFLALTAALVALSAIDLDTRRLPTKIIYLTLGFVALWLFAVAAATGEPERIGLVVGGGVLGRAPLWLANFLSPKGMGFGDVRLATLIGATLGWLGLGHVGLALFASFFLASVVGVTLLVLRRRSRKDQLPFGPYLAAGALVAVIAGRPILDWYGGFS